MVAAVDIDHGSLSAIVASLGHGGLVSVAPLPSGSAPVFKLDMSSGEPLVLKVFGNAQLPGKETYAARQVQAVPVTRHLVVDVTGARLPFPFTISNYLPGLAASAYATHPDAADLYRQMGAMLRSLHSIAMPAYGRFDHEGIVAPVATNEAFVHGLLDHAFAQFSHYGADPELSTRLRFIADDAFPLVVPHSKGPVFAHDDFQPNNVLAVEHDGRLVLSGLIDFGNAHAADAVCDLAKCLFCSEHEAPGSSRYILEGYGPVDHPDPTAALAFYTLLHRVIMWWFLRHIGVIATPDAPSNIMDDLRQMAAG